MEARKYVTVTDSTLGPPLPPVPEAMRLNADALVENGN